MWWIDAFFMNIVCCLSLITFMQRSISLRQAYNLKVIAFVVWVSKCRTCCVKLTSHKDLILKSFQQSLKHTDYQDLFLWKYSKLAISWSHSKLERLSSKPFVSKYKAWEKRKLCFSSGAEIKQKLLKPWRSPFSIHRGIHTGPFWKNRIFQFAGNVP